MSGVYIISAPSGSGKSTLVNQVRLIVPGLKFSISYTTRAPRAGEQNGREYYFVPRNEFEEMVSKNEFLEYADVFGNYYGTARRFLSRSGRRGEGPAAGHRRPGGGPDQAQDSGRGKYLYSASRTGRNWRSGCGPAVWMRKR